MSGVEVLAGLGMVATGLFRYNRENYEFDQEQRFDREELRLKMQVERFALFRDDVRDLVELTVSKMDLYHMVGALFLKACIVYYCEGFWIHAPPIFLLALYYLSNACAVVYLILGVWLAMHASISSHSYGTRLLTRFIRLPIPGSGEINVLNARYADFERQGVGQMLRVPFVNKRQEGKAAANEWAQRQDLDSPSRPKKQMLKEGVKALPDDDEELLQAVEMRTQRHVNLFRRLQAHWQCFDAYARVCMSLGARQLVQSITYFLIGVTLVENQNYALVFALVVCLQVVGASISILDISHWRCWNKLDITLLGWGPGLFAAISKVLMMNEGPHHRAIATALALATFPMEIVWFEVLLLAATPTDDMAALPQHFRSVMFMDVFSEVDDPTTVDIKTGHRKLTEDERDAAETALVEVAGHLAMAQSALRRWQTLPGAVLSEEQSKLRTIARRRMKLNLRELQDCLIDYSIPPLSPEELHARTWEEMTASEREDDPFVNTLLGPLEHPERPQDGRQFYLDLERGQYMANSGGRRILTLSVVLEKVENFQQQLLELREAAGDQARLQKRCEVGADSEDEEEMTPLKTRSDSATLLRTKTADISMATYKDGSKKVRAEPVRLPWVLVKFLTRMIQAVWLAVFLFSVARDYGIIHASIMGDTVEVHIKEDRRLTPASAASSSSLSSTLEATPLEVSWPMGAFFRPQALGCLPDSDPVRQHSTLLLSSPYALYVAPLVSTSAVSLQEVIALESPSTASICRHPNKEDSFLTVKYNVSCIFVAPQPSSHIEIWSPTATSLDPAAAPGDDVQVTQERQAVTMLAHDGAPWELIAGAYMLRRDVGLQVPFEDQSDPSPWCLVLIGWAGGRTLAVSVAPLAEEQGQGFSPVSGALRQLYEIPLAAAHQDPVSVSALHLDAETGRLWALLRVGQDQITTLTAFALLGGQPRQLGSWAMHATVEESGFRPAAVCQLPGSWDLLLAGRTEGRTGGPVVLRVGVPAVA